jgi:hypothetical protein
VWDSFFGHSLITRIANSFRTATDTHRVGGTASGQQRARTASGQQRASMELEQPGIVKSPQAGIEWGTASGQQRAG